MKQAAKLATTLALGCAAFTASALEVTQDEVNAFIAADENQNMSLDRSEFPTFVRHMAKVGQPTARKIVMFKAFGYAFGIADRNGDRKVTPEELRAGDDKYRAEND